MAIKYKQQNISLNEVDLAEWEGLKAKGWKASQVWKVGIMQARRMDKAMSEVPPDHDIDQGTDDTKIVEIVS
jgi:hypothetical protein